MAIPRALPAPECGPGDAKLPPALDGPGVGGTKSVDCGPGVGTNEPRVPPGVCETCSSSLSIGATLQRKAGSGLKTSARVLGI